MKFKSVIIAFILSIGFFQGCKFAAGNKVTINGNISNMAGKQLYLYQLLPASQPMIDSANVDAAGHFSFAIPVEKPGLYLVRKTPGDEITLIVLPHETITLNGDGNRLRNSYTVNGSKESKLYFEYQHFTNANLLKVDSLSRIFAESNTKPGFTQIKQQLDSAYLEIFTNQKQNVISFINSHLNSLASLLVISENFGPNPVLSEKTNSDLFLKLDSTLFRTYPENSFVNAFHLRMLSFKAELADQKAHDAILMPGKQAPEIALPNLAGKEIRLSSLQGKLTLVCFWSSWNALCRQNNINLNPIYNRFHNKGFEIYAVSLDSDTELWKNACLIDKAYWNQVIDTKGLQSEYSKTYFVRAMPKLLLVGRDGKIIANNPEFNELEELIRKNI